MNHRQAWNLIPWLVNGRLDGAQRERIETHVAGCAGCRAEVEAQRELMNAMRSHPRVEAMPPASLHRLWARLDAQPPAQAPQVAQPAPGAAPAISRRAAAAACAAALAVGGVLGVAFTTRPGPPAADFRTVSDTAYVPPVAALRAVFADGMTLAELQALLTHAGLAVVTGPSPSGVYTLAVTSPAADSQVALAELRAHPSVRFAEPAVPVSGGRP